MTILKTRTLVVYALLVVAEAAYVVLTWAAPNDPKQNVFGLTPTQLVLLQLAVIIPYLVTYYAGTRAAIDLERCGEVIPDLEGGIGFKTCGIGIAILVAGGLLSAILGTFRSFVVPNTAVAIGFIIASNYLYVMTEMFATLFLFKGAGQLVGTGGNRTRERDDLIMAGILSVIIAALYIPLVFSNPNRQVSVDATMAATYYLPDYVIVLSIILPNIIAWALGLLATLRIIRYAPIGRDRAQSRGIRRFVKGLWAVIYASILLQLLVSVGSDRLLALGLAPILMIVFLFIIVQIIGFVLLSFGSRQICRRPKAGRPLVVKAVAHL